MSGRRFFQLGEGRIPEMQVQDFALARQEIVLDVETLHGFKMATQNRDRNQVGDRGRFVVPFFDGMQVAERVCRFALSCSYHCETRA